MALKLTSRSTLFWSHYLDENAFSTFVLAKKSDKQLPFLGFALGLTFREAKRFKRKIPRFSNQVSKTMGTI